MSLEDLGNIGEFVGAVAVVVSLVYLALSIRHNTRQLSQNAELLRLSGRQVIKRDLQDIRLLGAQNAELLDLVRSGLGDLNSLNDSQKAQFRLIMAATFESYVFAWDYRAYDPVNWEVHAKQLRNYLSQPGARTWWETAGRDLYPERFVRHIEQAVLTDGEPSAPHWVRG